MISDLPLTIKDLQKGLLDKKFSAVELVDSFLSKIEKVNDQFNIFLTISDSKAHEQAKLVDKRISQLGDSALTDHPLLGVVGSYKDIFLTKGIRTTAASNVLKSYVPNYSATSVMKLENAGMIPLGKLNCDAWAHGSSGENSDFGPTLNPWDKNYTPGGSSSGSGAAIAAGLSTVTLGTDTCGSIRLPANYNYAVALKPTYGAVSRYGVISMASSLDTVGPFARCVEDIKIAFDVLKGWDGYDSNAVDFNYVGFEGKKKLRIGVPTEFFVDGIDDDVRQTVDSAIEVLKKNGIEFVEVSLPSTKYGIAVYYIVQPAEVSSNLGRFDGVRYGNGRDHFGPEAKRRIMLGSYVLSSGYYDAYYLKAMKVRSKIIAEVNDIFSGEDAVDAIIAPVAPTPAFKIGEKVDDPLSMYLTDIYAATANLCGIPSLALPSGFNKQGLPLGFQIMGPRFSEYKLFEIGNIYHKLVGYEPKIAF